MIYIQSQRRVLKYKYKYKYKYHTVLLCIWRLP